MPTRRDVLRTLGSAAAVAALPREFRAMTPQPSTPPRTFDGIGVQLYTLREAMRANPEQTIARIAAAGFQEIEWWGSWERTPAQLRALLDRHRLRSPSWHVDPRDLEADRVDATLEAARTMGQSHVIIAWLPPPQRTPEQFRRVATLLNAVGRKGQAMGIRTGYHNHDFEFTTRVGDGTLLDFLLTETDPAVVDIELDCYWAFKAGHDPVALLRQHAMRITHLHLKDSGPAPDFQMRDVGAGVIDWRAVLSTGGANRVRHGFVEHDSPADPWATVSAGRRHLQTLGY